MRSFSSLADRTKLLRDCAGFTLTEVLATVGVVTLAAALVGSSLYATLSVQRVWHGDVTATRELRNAESWFSTDAVNTQSTDLTDGAPPASSASLTWTDGDGIPHTALYSLVESNLVRDFGGVQTYIARRVVSAGFSLSGRVLILDLEVEAEEGQTEDTSLQSYLRMLD